MEILYEAQTSFFIAVVITRLGCVIVCKTRRLSIFKQGIFSNWVLDIGLGVEIALAILLCYVPFLHTIFLTRPVSYKIWLIGLPFFAFVVVSDELRKWWMRKHPGGWVERLTYW